MMVKNASTIALKADPNDPEDFDVSEAAVRRALEERQARRRGRGPQKAPTKQAVTLRLDREIIERYKAGGPGWQSRINEALRATL